VDFKDRLLSLRTESGLDQKSCASALGLKDNSKYNKWENGKNRPDYETVCMIADHYGVSTDYLLGRTDAKHPENALLVSELGLSDKAIEVIKDFRTSYYPQYPLYHFVAGKAPIEIDQSCDKRTLADVLDAMLCSEMMEPVLNILRTLTSPIPERLAFTQWEGERHASAFTLETSFDAQYKGMLHEALDGIAHAVLSEAFEGKVDETQIDIFENERDKQDGE